MNGRGGVGEERECESDQGVVHQRILEWVPERHLTFRMERTTLPAGASISEMTDTIDLAPADGGVVVTRSTRARIGGRFRFFKGWLVAIGLKQVHRVVFREWRRLAE